MSKSFNGRITKWVWDGNVILHEWVEYSDDVNDEEEILDDLQSEEAVAAFLQAQLDGRPSNGPPEKCEIPLPTTWLFDPDTFVPASKIVGDKHYSIITDHLGTPLSMYNEMGVQAWAAELDIYGCVKNLQGDRSDCPFRYPGQYEDGEIGLYYNRFRYYDPVGGEYVSQDPIRLAGGNLNIYAYPYDVNSFTDIFGLYAFYQLLNSAGDVVHQGITDRTVQERLIEHARDGKNFDQVRFVDNLKDRVSTRNLEGSALYHSHSNGAILQNAKRLDGGYYHSYNPDKLAAGRTFLSEAQINDTMKNATVKKVDSKGKSSCS